MPKGAFTERLLRSFVTGIITTSSFVSQGWLDKSIAAQANNYCHFSREATTEKSSLRQAWLQGKADAEDQYKSLLKKHGEILQQCRSRTWPGDQAIWLRLYSCDTLPGSVEEVLDNIVDRGYNQVYVEVFFDGQVLLPSSDNPTPWIPVLRASGQENTDLLEEVIAKGRERGLEVYAWMFTMNFGYNYARRAERQHALARNGRGQTSLSIVPDGSQVFIDPYNRQAQVDYYRLVQAIAKRQPDGILFDYIRYPRGSGSQSVAGSVKDLWIYGQASRQALYSRALNNQGRFLIQQYVSKGNISARDVRTAEKRYPEDSIPMWQGRQPLPDEERASLSTRHRRLQVDLWHLTVAHAAQGVIDFLSFASTHLQEQNIPAGAVFFPDANQPVGQRGFDSRLQPWDKFPTSLEWHAMSYGACGSTNCIVDKVRRLVQMSQSGVKLIPAIAGVWGRSFNNRPSLEVQMQAIRRVSPQINGVSHFAYSWQDPESDRERKFCKLP